MLLCSCRRAEASKESCWSFSSAPAPLLVLASEASRGRVDTPTLPGGSDADGCCAVLATIGRAALAGRPTTGEAGSCEGSVTGDDQAESTLGPASAGLLGMLTILGWSDDASSPASSACRRARRAKLPQNPGCVQRSQSGTRQRLLCTPQPWQRVPGPRGPPRQYIVSCLPHCLQNGCACTTQESGHCRLDH